MTARAKVARESEILKLEKINFNDNKIIVSFCNRWFAYLSSDFNGGSGLTNQNVDKSILKESCSLI